MHFHKIKHILFTAPYIICVFMLMSLLLISMTLRYYIRTDIVFQSVQSVIQENVGIPLNLNIPVRVLFRFLEPVIDKGKIGLFLKIMTSVWIQPMLLLLMIGMLIWMVKIHIRGKRKPGKAFQIFGITASFPSSISFISGVMLSKGISLLNLPEQLEIALQGKIVFYSGVSIGICMILFCIGTVWNKRIKAE